VDPAIGQASSQEAGKVLAVETLGIGEEEQGTPSVALLADDGPFFGQVEQPGAGG
jgi:hypothetical protein